MAERGGAQGAHLRATGKALVEDPERTKDPVDFVQRLLARRTSTTGARPPLAGLRLIGLG